MTLRGFPRNDTDIGDGDIVPDVFFCAGYFL